MKLPFKLHSTLMAKASLLLAVLLILSLTRNVMVLGFTWAGLHDTGAINAASSLRVEAGQLVRKIARGEPVEKLQAVLTSMNRDLHDAELQLALDRPGREVMRATHQRLLAHWDDGLYRRLLQGDGARVIADVEFLAEELDHLAGDLQQEHSRLHSLDLRLILFMAIVLPLLYLLAYSAFRKRVATPLQELVAATEQFRAGHFDVRVPVRAQDEIGQLARAFNTMAETIGNSHRSLEESVQHKMQRLAQANAALQLLFRSSHSVAEHPLGADALEDLVRRFEQLLPGLQLSLCLEPVEVGVDALRIAVHGDAQRQICATGNCASCEHQLATQQLYEVRSQGHLLGKLRARFIEDRPMQPWEGELLQALADLVGSALLLGRQREQGNHLLLLTERNTIARELHDSLAQSLSYMKLQVSRLDLLIRNGEDPQRVEAVSKELRDGLNDAYRQLRELLTTFRLSLGSSDLAAAMESAAAEFASRGGFSVTFKATPLATPLSANEQVDLLQIMREALANCSRHAQAQKVSVVLRQASEEVELVIDDDGQGLSALDNRRHHHGITIMQERAGNIRGTLEVVALQPRGTRVRLAFRPHFLSA